MKNSKRLKWLAAFALGLVACFGAASAWADPPDRVARLSYESGSVSFSPAGEDDWSRASVNRPLITGDRLWVDAGSRAELQLGGTALRVGDETSVTLLNVDDSIAQVQLTQGELDVRVWRLDPGQTVEIDTPNLAYVINRTGSYRVDVDPKYGSTAVTVRSGDATLYGEGNAFRIGPGETWEFYDTALRDYDQYRPDPFDDLARFAQDRDRRWEESVSARHVSREVIGYQDLDAYGAWQQVPDYGWVWFPTRVAAGWAPYREGHWAWVEPWGWTWIDDAPWGFAPSHYGRWAFFDNRWCWVPGPANVRPVYAPALVAFVGGSGLSVSIGAGGGVVGWFPLGPRDVYRPAYPVSRDYFTRVNVSNTVVNVTQVVNVYNTRNVTNVRYVNERVPGAVVAVPTQTFTHARPVAREAVRIRPENVQPQAIVAAPPVAPAKQSVIGPQAAQRKPPEHVFSRQVVAQTPPPPPPASIEQKLPALRSHPGQPLPPASAPARARPGTQGAAPAPAVKVVPHAQPAAASPPPAPGANRPQREEQREQRREQREQQRERPAPSPHGAPTPPPPSPQAATPATPAPPAAPAPAVQPPVQRPAPAAEPQRRGEERARSEERGRGEERQRERPPPAPARPAAPPPAPAAPPAAVPATPPSPPMAPQRREERREQQEQRREQREERREVPAPAQAPAPRVQAAPAAPPAPAAPAPPVPQAAPPAAQRAPNARAEQRREAASERRQEREERREERR